MRRLTSFLVLWRFPDNPLVLIPHLLSRKRRAPARIEVATGAGSHAESVEDYYRQKYYEGLDMCVASIKDRFNQPGYQLYRNLELVMVMVKVI